MTDKRLHATHNSGIQAIWNLLMTGDVFYRAAGILLLKAHVQTLIAAGKYEYASRLVQAFRENDPMKSNRPKEDKERMRP